MRADLREADELWSVNQVVKIMRQHKLKAQIGYKRRHIKGGKTSRIADNCYLVSLILLRRIKLG
ncbi:hypothetical protein [Pseudoalteromonas luteoviolacea]|uniref:hypothetical protein n=1 Tax=Pseudoalteromonas luteoviolacea TaxID=43657 RepID=UPI0011522A57|nr:hypothetical protein FLM44_18690 [Pseudoalteromonas luteoviolacea]